MLAALLLSIALVTPTPTTTTTTTTTTATPERGERLLVFNFTSDGVDERIVRSIERVVVETAVENGYDAISQQDIAAMLDIEASRQAAGCDGQSSCIAELAGGLGAQLVVTGQVVRLDARRYELSLTLLEQNATTVRGRASVDGERAADLRALTADTTRRLFGVPTKARHDVDNTPSVLWIGGGITGAAVGVVGVVFGVLQYTNAQTNAGYAKDAADAYVVDGSAENLAAIGKANEAYADRAEAWNTWGAAMVAVGSAFVVGGVAAIVVGATGLE